MSFRKMIEQALGEMMQEMAPPRPEIDPVDQRRRPDMSQAPTPEGKRMAVGERPVAPESLPVPGTRPAPADRGVPSPRVPAEGRQVPADVAMAEGRMAPREVGMNEGRNAPREAVRPEGATPQRPRSRLQTTLNEAPPMAADHVAGTNRLRTQLATQNSIRNAFRVMEVLRPPLALRDQRDNDENR